MLTKALIVWAVFVLTARRILDWWAINWIFIYLGVLLVLLGVAMFELFYPPVLPAPCYVRPNSSIDPLLHL